ncbi:unnamed protein product [Vitrella brassicaformis CCMP3155]|uniref:Uncharacterized protein n=1 Tax=Vitrella brassicaformis (strain CCMP3155) TaxID=1169540 RepID=A0A0G4EI78_VITBC|nr:unnamed protein product [Vitrella brassicaformis CCMP3155]|eukprot:CEL95953.1 unnamed protein product [Vitrella brassicaformis CCMP3155]
MTTHLMVVDSVLPMDISSDGGPAPSRGGQGDGSLRDVIDQIHSVASHIAASSEAAKLKVPADAGNDTQACVSLIDRLSDVLKTLSDADSRFSNELLQIPTTDARMATARASGGCTMSTTDPPVSTGDGKRSRVGTSQAAAVAAASSGGGSSSVGGAAGGTQQQRGSSQGYGRPCLPGLPEGVMGHLGSFLTTAKAAARLPKVNRETRQKAVDETFGVFRHFSVTANEEGVYGKIQRLEDMKHLGKIRTAYVEMHSVVPCVGACLEASRATLKQLHTSNWLISLDESNARAPGDPISFPKLTDMGIQSKLWLQYVSIRRWALPALTNLEVCVHSYGYPEASRSLVSVLEGAPKIERIETKPIAFDDDTWARFITAVSNCPHITTITCMTIRMDQFVPRLNDLKQALDQHWSKPKNKDVPKRLAFSVRGASIGVASDAASALPAPGGLYGEIARQLIAKTKTATLKLGGTQSLHETWRDKLTFPKASTLAIQAKEGASASAVVDSIPEWLIGDREWEGEGYHALSRRFPAVRELHVFFPTLPFSDLPSAPSKLSRLVGGLEGLVLVWFRSLSRIALACELLSYVSVTHLEMVAFWQPPASNAWPDSVPAEWRLRCPRISRGDLGLWVDASGKAVVRSLVQFVSIYRPVHVNFAARIAEDELEGEDQIDALGDLRSLAWECFEDLKALYTMTSGSCELNQREEYWLKVDLVAK